MQLRINIDENDRIRIDFKGFWSHVSLYHINHAQTERMEETETRWPFIGLSIYDFIKG